ncbi:PQQ-like beta-propeller repeat protein [bacterium]|nr:PQQ-like beta-propeller repeat protein [bacterium]
MIRYLITLVAIVWASSVCAEDWPRYHGPDNNGISKETGLLKKWPDGGPKILWTKPLGTGYSSVSVAKGHVYTMYQDAQKQYVVCFDEKTGNKLWETPTGPIYDARDAHDGPRATPTVDGDFVYAIDGNGEIVCMKAAGGNIVWQKNMLKMAGAGNITWGIAQSAFIVGEKLFVNPGGNNGMAFMALNKKDGSIAWKSGNGLAGYATPVVADFGGVKQLVFAAGKQVAGVRMDDGKILWSFPWVTRHDVNAASPIVMGDMVFVSSGYHHGSTVYKIDMSKPNPAEKVWQNTSIQAHFGTPILMDGYLYGYRDMDLTCVDFKTGATKWFDEEGAMPPKGQLTYADGLYYILGENGLMILARLTPERFEKISQMDISPGSERWAPLAIANGRLYMRDNKQLFCLDIKAK